MSKEENLMESPKVHKILFGVIVTIGILLILAALLVFKGFSLPKQGETLKKPVITPTPTPTPYPIAQGNQIYNVNTNNKSGPRMSKVTIDPLDARMGETQTISVVVKSTGTVTGVMVALRTDKNVFTNHKLALASGTAMDGVWSASWRMEVIHDYLYQVTITATDTETSNSTTVTIR